MNTADSCDLFRLLAFTFTATTAAEALRPRRQETPP